MRIDGLEIKVLQNPERRGQSSIRKICEWCWRRRNRRKCVQRHVRLPIRFGEQISIFTHFTKNEYSLGK